MSNALVNKIYSVINMIKEEACEGAINKLENDISGKKTDVQLRRIRTVMTGL